MNDTQKYKVSPDGHIKIVFIDKETEHYVWYCGQKSRKADHAKFLEDNRERIFNGL